MSDSTQIRPDLSNAPQTGAAGAQSLAKAQGAAMPVDVKQGQVLPAPKRRNFIIPMLVLVAIGFGGYKGYNYFVEGRFRVATDDAYVKADTAVIAAKISGYIETVPFDNNNEVKAGDILTKIDPVDFELAVTAAKNKLLTQDAALLRMDTQMKAQNSTIEQARAQLEAAEADQARAALAYVRTSALTQSGNATQAALEQAIADRDRTSAVVEGGKAAVNSAEAGLQVLKAQRNEVSAARSELEIVVARAQRDLDATIVRAPFDGVIGNRAAQPGQYVQPGVRLMALVPLDAVYIEANFKETQLARIKPGQKVDLELDAMSGRKVEGTVQGLSPASGSEFSLLPPENATGNFTKIVQRVPVRIAVDPEVAREHILRPGLSVGVSVRTRDESLPKPSLLSALGLDRLFSTANASH